MRVVISRVLAILLDQMTVMTKVEWCDRYYIGNDRIDREHQAMFELVNSLQRAIDCGESMAVLGAMLEVMAQHTIAHFQHEESLMRSHSYPGYTRHKQCHDRLIQKVTKLINEFQQGEAIAMQGLTNFLADWLKHHIKGEDQKMIAFFQLSHPKQDTKQSDFSDFMVSYAE